MYPGSFRHLRIIAARRSHTVSISCLICSSVTKAPYTMTRLRILSRKGPQVRAGRAFAGSNPVLSSLNTRPAHLPGQLASLAASSSWAAATLLYPKGYVMTRGKTAARGLHFFPYSTPPRGGRTARRLTAFAAALAIMLLAGCADKPVVVAVDTLCASTSRPQITEAQRAAFRADQATWESLVDWLAGFIKVRDEACLKPGAGP